MRALTPADALRLRARLRPREVVLVDAEGSLTAADLLDLARERAERRPPSGGGLVRLEPGPLREILAAIAAPGARGLVLRTSGTTGAPRGQRRGPLRPGQLLLGLDLARRIGLRPGLTLASAAPGEHGHGLSAAAGALALGMRLVDLSRLDPALAHRLLARTCPDVVTGVPAHLLDLARSGPLPVPRAVSGSDVLTDAMRRELLEAGAGRVHDVYGTTETGALCVDGLPLRGVRLRAQDGLLRARTPFTGGRELVTDRGSIGPDGRVRVIGRADGRIASGGLLHDPAAVEALIAQLPGIVSVRLEAVPDDRMGTRTRAHVRRDGGPLDQAAAAEVRQQVREHVRAHLGPAAVPREVVLDPPAGPC